MTKEVQPDGTIIIQHNPIEGMPNYGDWLKFVLSRGHAEQHRLSSTEASRVSDGKGFDDSGRPRLVIHPCEANASLIDGVVKFTCIACGLAWNKLSMDTIRIGGFIQIPTEERRNPKLIVRGFTTRPTSKTGLGCPTCQCMYQAEVAKANVENAAREHRATLIARIAVLEAQRQADYTTRDTDPVKRVKLPGPITPWIQVL